MLRGEKVRREAHEGNESGASLSWLTRPLINIGYVSLSSRLGCFFLALSPFSPWLHYFVLLLRHNHPLDLDASSRLRSSSYPSYNTIPAKQFSNSPSEEILSHYVHTTFPSHPPLSMYSSHHQRDESLVGSWLPSAAGASADVSHPADPSSTLTAPPTAVSSKSNYSPSHTVTSSTTTTTTHNDQTRHARFHHPPGETPSDRHQSFSSQQHPGSLNRHLSEPNIRSAAVHPPPHYSLPHATESRYRQQRRPQHRQSFQQGTAHVLPSPGSASVSADRRPSTADSAASSGWESRGDIHAEPFAEPLQGMAAAMPTQGAHKSLASSPILLNDPPFLPDLPPDQNTSPIERYPPVFANPFGDHNYADARPRSSGMVCVVTVHPRLHSPTSSLIPVARSDEEHDIVTADPAVSKTYSFVSLPGNAVKKRPRRRYDEIERLYHCSWLGCTKSYGTLNHLNAHIVMQRHGGKRTPAGEIHSLFHD